MTKLSLWTAALLLPCFGAFSQKLPELHQWDTTQAFPSFKETLPFRKANDSILFAFSKKYPDKQFQCDSLNYLMQDNYAIALYKTLLRDKKSQDNFYKLSLIPHFTFAIEKDRFLDLFQQYPKAFQQSSVGKNMLAILNRTGVNEGLNIRKVLASTQLQTMDGENILLEKVLVKQPIYILAFGASWCSPCKYNDRILHQAAAGWDSSRIKIIHLSIDTDPKKWRAGERLAVYNREAYLLKEGIRSALTKALNINGVQRYIVINGQGDVILDHISGKILIKKLEPLVKEPITVAMLYMLY